MKLYALGLAITLGTIVSINVWVDAAGIDSYGDVAALTRAQTPGSLIVSQDAFDQRAWTKTRLAGKNGCPDLLLLGSSTIGAWSAAFTPGERILNAWLTGPMIEDFEAISHVLREGACAPKRVVFAVDPWLVNAGVSNARWMSLFDEYLSYHQDNAPWRKLLAKTSQQWNLFKERLSFEATRESLGLLLTRARAGVLSAPKPKLIEGTPEVYCAAKPTAAYVRAYDGHFIQCPTWLLDAADIQEIARSYVERNMHGMREFREVDAARMRALAAVVSALRARGSRVLIYAPPYHPITYAKLRAQPLIAAALDDYDRQLTDLATRTGASFVSLRAPSSVPCAPNEFEDSHHASPECVAKVAARVLR